MAGSADNSLKYKIRLVLAYRDVLRNHLPFVSDRYIKAFRRSQLEAARALRSKSRIDVAFFLTIPGMWKSDYLFKALRDNPRYHPYVVIYPYSTYKGFSKEEVDATLERTREFIEEKGFEYVIPFDGKRNRWLDVKKAYNPDIVVFTTPYKDFPPDFFVYHFRDRLTCYVPYGYGSLNMSKVNYDLIFHNLVGLHFVETDIHKQFATQYSRNKGENVVVTGYPGTEVFQRTDYIPKNVWKPQEKEKKRVIWAPHHTIDSDLALSTFLLRCDDMIALAKKYRDTIQFAFKPHQLLKFKLQNLWGEERTKNYYDHWATMENTQLEESGYVDLFLTSDAMMHDCGSFTTEYLFVNKPVMYLTHDEHFAERFNPFGQMSFQCHYKGSSVEEIERFLQKTVVEGDDPKRSERNAMYEKYFKPADGMLPSESIIREIEKMYDQTY